MQQLDHILSGLTEDPRGGALHDVVVLAPGYTHGERLEAAMDNPTVNPET